MAIGNPPHTSYVSLSPRKLAMWIGVALCFPLITIVTRGFIGYGAGAAVCVLVFVSSFVRSRVRITAAALVVGLLGVLSLLPWPARNDGARALAAARRHRAAAKAKS